MAWTNWEPSLTELNFKFILYEKKYQVESGGGVARITMNRPEKMNCVSPSMDRETWKALYDASNDPMIGVVILTGAGDNFSAGGDIEWERWGYREQFFYPVMIEHTMRLCRKPILAVVKGYAIGGGNHFAYTCDFTIAAENAIFGQNGPRVSSPVDCWPANYLVYTVGMKKAREMWMLCRRYTAQEALQMGLVNAVVSLDKLDEEVDRWCEDILAASPGCLEILKATFDYFKDNLPQIGVNSNLMYPGWTDTPEGNEGGEAFLNKRPPAWWKIRKQEAEGLQKVRDKILPPKEKKS